MHEGYEERVKARHTNSAAAAALFMAKTRLLNRTEGVAKDAELILQQQI
jgi:hypothetical protein